MTVDFTSAKQAKFLIRSTEGAMADYIAFVLEKTESSDVHEFIQEWLGVYLAEERCNKLNNLAILTRVYRAIKIRFNTMRLRSQEKPMRYATQCSLDEFYTFVKRFNAQAYYFPWDKTLEASATVNVREITWSADDVLFDV